MEVTKQVIFGCSRKEDEYIGIHKRAIAAKVNDTVKLVKAQYGGAVTAIMLYLLEEKSVRKMQNGDS